MASVVSAFRIARTSRPGPSTYLTPFALCPALPDSDYYGVSVAMRPPCEGSSLLGDLALPVHTTFRARVRPPTHPLNRVHTPDRCTGRSCRPRPPYSRHPMHAAS